jgi:hypothetical protein
VQLEQLVLLPLVPVLRQPKLQAVVGPQEPILQAQMVQWQRCQCNDNKIHFNENKMYNSFIFIKQIYII